MTNKQESKLKMYLAVSEFLLKNEPLTKDLPEFPASFAEFQNTISQIKLIDEQQKNVRTGIAKDKKGIKNSLISMAAENSGKIYAFAKVTNNKALQDEVNFSISEIGRMTDVALRSYAEALYKKAEQMLEALNKYGITAETQKIFAATIAAYNNSLAKPRVGIAEKSKATKQLETLFNSADTLVGKIDAIIGIIRYNQVNFYNGFRTVRKLVGSNAGVVALKAIANDLRTGNPLKGAIFTFRINGTTITKRTADKGIFYIKNMAPGRYDVIIKKEGYAEKTLSVSIQDGQRNELSVELEKA
jgi:hypothetical protein